MTTNDFDNFDQDAELANAGEDQAKARPGLGANLSEAWKTKPLFKLIVIMVVVGVAIIVSLSVSSGSPTPETSRFVHAPDINEVPGGKASPYFIEQNKQAANQRADQAMQQGGSAIPTPVGQSMEMGETEKKDPLIEFRAETERLKQELKQEQQRNTQQIQVLQQQVQAPVPQAFDDSLAQAMQRQMQTLSDSWQPQAMKVVTGHGEGSSSPAVNEAQASAQNTKTSGNGAMVDGNGNGLNLLGGQNTAASKLEADKATLQAQEQDKVLVTAGTVSYGQLLTEANSDIPGVIMAQIVSGPFSGGRAIGAFQVHDDYLSLTFTNVNYKGRDYAVNIVALNPNTTLSGMATEVDPRYLKRVVLPAAGEFVSAFGDAMSSADTTTTVTDNAVMTSSARKGFREGMYSGIGKAGEAVSDFMKNEANRTKQLVRIASGTPMGMFFTQSVRDISSQAAVVNQKNEAATKGLLGSSSTGPYSLSSNRNNNQGYQGYTTNPTNGVRIYGPNGNSYYNGN